MTAPSLKFRSFDTTEIGSIAMLYGNSKPDDRCGIYVLRFETGESYVGQAVDVVSRYATHRRRWGDIVSLEFASCAREDLDECERRVVSAEEEKGSLRNILLTGTPGGWGDIEVEVEASSAPLILPWERDRRVTIASEPVTSPLARFWKLSSRSDYTEIRRLLARYIQETIPDPVLTTHGMWTLTALPTTGKTKNWVRMLTFNCGRLETLYLGNEIDDSGRESLVITLNVSATVGRDALLDIPLKWGKSAFIMDTTHASAEVISLQFVGLKALRAALASPTVLDAAYRLNVELMRQGSKLFARYHNAPFAYDVLSEVHRNGQ